MPDSEHTPHLAAGDDPSAVRRSLVLAGGGMRVAWQAGVLLALGEAGQSFHHADGTSGGTINLAMLLSGLSPEEMCERWRTLRVKDFVSFMPLGEYLKGLGLMALGDADGVVGKVFPHLGIDVDRIRSARGIEGTFNACNYTEKTNEAIAHHEVDLDFLVAAISLPVFMPPVRRGSAIYTDSVWIRDANLIEAVRRGCRELWLVWCIGNTGRYRSGILPQYVHMIEMSANGTLFEDFERIRETNGEAEPTPGGVGQESGPIRLHVVRPEFPLPLDPEFYEGRVSADTLIAMGYRDARAYLGRRRPEGVALDPRATRMRDPGRTVMFRESWVGPFALGAHDPAEGARRGEAAGTTMTLEAAVEIHDLDRFIREVDHTGALCGYVTFVGSGGRQPVAGGTFNVFAPAEGRPDDRVCAYDLSFGDDRRPYCLAGRRELHDDPGIDVWGDLSTMFVTLHDGTGPGDPVIGAGVLRADAGDLRRTITSVHVVGADSLPERVDTAADFGRFVLGRLWATYGLG